MKRLTSLVLAVILSVGMLAAFTIPASAISTVTGTTVVYVDGESGTSTGGATPDNPMKSFVGATQAVAKAGGGTVVLVGPAEITSNTSVGSRSNDAFIKVTSVYDGNDYRDKGCLRFPQAWKNLILENGFIFENLVIEVGGDQNSIYADHSPVVMGYGIETKGEKKLNVYGGSAFDLSASKNFPANSSITVLSGSFGLIKAAGKGSDDKPRPTIDARLALGEGVECTNDKAKVKTFFSGSDTWEISGTKLFISYNGAACEETVDNTMTVTGTQGYIIPLAAKGEFYVLADKGYGAEIDGTVVANGKTEIKNLDATVKFVESDVNANAEKELLKPKMLTPLASTYMNGYNDGTFKPSKDITIAEASTIIVRLCGKTDVSKEYTETKFENVKSDDWFFNTIAYLEDFGFYDDFENFDPNRAITRAEFVSLVNKSASIEKKSEALSFSDVPETHKYYDAIMAASSNKLVNGYNDGTFRPDKTITRAEVVAVINRVCGAYDSAEILNKNKRLSFSDVPKDHWAYFQIVVAAGGVDFTPTIDNPKGTGEVEYKVEGKVVYLDGIKGNASNDGSSPDKAVNDFYSAGKLLGDEGGTIVISGQFKLGSNVNLATKNKLLVTSVYDGVDYRETNDAMIIFPTWKNLIPTCDTIFDNLTIMAEGTNASIYCDNRNVIFGKDIVCIKSAEKSAYINIYGGSACDLGGTVNYIKEGVTEAYSNVFVRGGIWGAISGTGKGDAKKPTHCTGTAVIIESGADFTGATAGKSLEFCEIRGKRLLGTIGGERIYTPGEEVADYTFFAKGEGSVTVVEQKPDYVVIKAVAADGKKITGTAEDGTYKFEGTEKAITIDFEKGTLTDGVEGASEFETIPDDVLAALDKKTEDRIAEIKATKTEVKPTGDGKAYYVSASTGNDSNDGLTEATAWKTLDKLSAVTMTKGSVVYFKRGDLWRDVKFRARSGITYSAYGEGDKPKFYGSPFDGAVTGKWEATDTPNVYKYSERIADDVGQIVFNGGDHSLIAQKTLYDGPNAVTGYKDLKKDLEFFHDLGGKRVEATNDTGYIYLCSTSGNPAERFTNIEFNRRNNVFSAGNNITFDNLCIAYGGSHGVGAGTCEGLTVQNCEFWWIGGALQNYNEGAVRFGNAVEIYGGATDYTVSNCYIDQVYDAGVTHQVSHETEGDFIMKNVTYKDNVILRCVYSIEHFIRAREGTTRYQVNISYTDNICRYAGDGFGKTRPDKTAPSHIRSGGAVDTANFVISGNVFDRSTNQLFIFEAGGDEAAEFKGNTFIQTKGKAMFRFSNAYVPFNGLIPAYLEKNFKSDGKNIFYYAK